MADETDAMMCRFQFILYLSKFFKVYILTNLTSFLLFFYKITIYCCKALRGTMESISDLI